MLTSQEKLDFAAECRRRSTAKLRQAQKFLKQEIDILSQGRNEEVSYFDEDDKLTTLQDRLAIIERELERRELRSEPQTSTKVNAETRKKRRGIVTRYRAAHDLTMADLARRANMSVTAIEGMVKGDRTRYSEETLSRLLGIIGVLPEQW